MGTDLKQELEPGSRSKWRYGRCHGEWRSDEEEVFSPKWTAESDIPDRKIGHDDTQKFKAAAAARKEFEIEGEDTVNERTVQRWFDRFNCGDLSLADHSQSGRPSEEDIEATKDPIENQLNTNTCRLSDCLGPCKGTISRVSKPKTGALPA
ncbi:Histone-lysine N-methyltransferase SETMAR [Eumeta japonica]|uniref:Histone-lysine N-methyltransferase SETMAR n=1 Tax=Eumeta variegata TaxID=151549 RepID=A0A4C1X7E1_EUMVA|nr:Histone-lysine N-methyltransferase SETMAR [Eumeta japonica]